MALYFLLFSDVMFLAALENSPHAAKRRLLNDDNSLPVLCFVGDPRTGKSLALSGAMSLGGQKLHKNVVHGSLSGSQLLVSTTVRMFHAHLSLDWNRGENYLIHCTV